MTKIIEEEEKIFISDLENKDSLRCVIEHILIRVNINTVTIKTAVKFWEALKIVLNFSLAARLVM